MSENPVIRVLHKALLIAGRDGPGVLLRKVLAGLVPLLLHNSVARALKRAVPPRIKEWLRRRRESVPPPALVEQELLPPGTPLAAVIIPCYNYGQYLPEAVAGALCQTLGNIEIIVVDDGSSDPLTITVLENIEAGGRVRVIRQPNKGLPAARNTGIRATSARYIACLDADDLIDPTYLEKAVMVLESRPHTGLAYSYAQLFGDVEEIWHTETLDPVKLLQYNHIPVVAVFRRDAWEKVGGYDESMRIGYEDWDFWLRLAGAGYAGHLIPEPLFKHRRHGKTMTHRAQEKHLQLVREIKSKHSGVAQAQRLPAVEVKPGRAFVNLQAAPPAPGRRRLLVLVPWLVVGGAETVLLQVIKAFEDSGDWEVYLAATLDSTNEWAGRFSAITPRLYIMPHLFPRRYFIDAISSLMQRHGIESVLISHSELAYIGIEELRKIVPGPLLILDLLHNDSPEGYSRLSARTDSLIDGHIAVHEGIKNTMVDKLGVAPEKIFVIPNGVDPERFKPGDFDRGELKKMFGLDPDSRQAAFIGRLSIEKNPRLFIEAAARLRDIDHVEWVCYGDGILEREMREAAESTGSPVKFMGVCQDTAALLKAVDLLVLTSDTEGLPMVVVEALMSGVPVVATNVGCLDVVVRNGVNGHLVNRGDVDELCRVLGDLLRQPEKLDRMKEHCRPSVVDRFSGSEMAGAYVKLYETLLGSMAKAGGLSISLAAIPALMRWVFGQG